MNVAVYLDREIIVPTDPKDPNGDPAETEFVTISRAAHRVAWMALRPHTGRTHQLRAHMLAMGHPILGDPKYKTEESAQLSGNLKLQLHARRLTLPHPSRGTLTLEAPISKELTDDVVTQLNGRVDNDGEEPRDVARDWLVEQGFIAG